MSKPENTGAKQAKKPKDGKFATGESGNPAGRPKGSKNKTTLAAEALLDGEAEEITRRCIDMAKSGDMAAIRICMDRLIPPRKHRPITLALPAIERPEDILKAVDAITQATTKGEIALDEANSLLGLVEAARRALETEAMHRELDDLKIRLGLLSA